jgi:hypothetical protein
MNTLQIQITSILLPPFPVVFYLPCAFICWWCCNLLTSNQDLWLVRDKDVSWSLQAVQNRTCSIPKCVSCNFMTQSNSTVYTVFFGLWYMIQVSWYIRIYTCACGQSCRKRSPLGQGNSGLSRQMTNSYEIFYDRTRKG